MPRRKFKMSKENALPYGGGRTQELAYKLGASEWADGSFFGTGDWMGKGSQSDYAEALLGQARAARENGRPKIAKAYERFAKNNGATAAMLKEYRSDVRAEGLSVG